LKRQTLAGEGNFGAADAVSVPQGVDVQWTTRPMTLFVYTDRVE